MHQLALVDDDCAAREIKCPFHVLLDQQQGRALVPQAPEQHAHLLHQHRHDAFGRLIQQHHLGLRDDGARDGEHLLLATGHGGALLLEPLLEAWEALGDLVDCLPLVRASGGDEAELRLEDVRVEPWQVVGELHQGFAAALYGVSLGRIYNSARAVGYGRWALELALEYAKTRKAFDRPIADYQGVTFPLAESATELHGAHLMGLNAALLLDQGAPAIKELSMAKAYSVQVGYRAVDRAMQTHGAMGFTNEVGLHHAWHSLRIVNVADGTNEILNRGIVQRLLKGDVEI